MAELRVGTCSWKDSSWAGLVYSAPRGIDFLCEYTARFNSVEVDQWYWSLFAPDRVVLPKREHVLGYRAVVPASFRFSVKAPNSLTLTHLDPRQTRGQSGANRHLLSNALMDEFLLSLAPLHDVLGPVLLQFSHMNRRKMPSRHVFLQRLATFAEGLDRQFRYAIEVRNPDYVGDALYRTLLQNELAPVLMQGYWMPDIWRIYGAHRDLIIRQSLVVLRLMGPDRGGIHQQAAGAWNRIITPKPDELAEIAALIADLLDAGVDVYVNVDNHYEGSAPLTAARLLGVLGREPEPPAQRGPLPVPHSEASQGARLPGF